MHAMGTHETSFVFILLAAVCVAYNASYDGSRCVNQCYGDDIIPHGYCDGGLVPLCQCIDQYNNDAWDCSERACPAGTSWFDYPNEDGIAHTTQTPCSNKGQCDYLLGTCKCERGFEGDSCQRTQCPGTVNGVGCSGHGRCITMREAAATKRSLQGHANVVYDEWDADMIQGCICDDGWTGYDCSLRQCPVGTDPLDIGGAEIQQFIVAEGGSAVQEVQIITLAAGDSGGGNGVGDVNEVQTININGVSSLPTGTFTLTFDSRPSTGFCGLCIVSATASTTAITLSTTDALQNAANVRSALEALPNIGVGNVLVSASFVGNNHVIAVTFTGNDVGGDVTLLSAGCTGISGGTCSVIEHTAGSELGGVLTLSYDDTTRYPTAASLSATGDTTDSATLATQGIRYSLLLVPESQPTEIATEIASLTLAGLESATNTLTVTREGTGGPGISWRVTFHSAVRHRGNLPQLDVTHSLTLAHPSLTAPTTSAAVTTVQDGVFMGGTFSLQLAYTDAEGDTQYTSSTAALAWNAAASTVQTALNLLDTGVGLGRMAVSRARYPVGVSSGLWRGGYVWSVTFNSYAKTYPIHPDPDGSGLTGVSPTVSTVQAQAGDVTAPTNAIIVLECICTTCSNPAEELILLIVNEATTVSIPYNSNAAAIAAALSAVPGIGEVVVRIVDVVSATTATICDTDGSAAEITFTQYTSAKRSPILRVSSDTSLPVAGRVRIVTEGWGTYGGVAQKNTRIELECSGRGTCDHSTGTCSCYTNSVGTALYAASNNRGGLGYSSQAASPPNFAFENCGHTPATVTSCPTTDHLQICSGHGTCSGAPSYTCQCTTGYSGPACDVVECPSNRAWFDIAAGRNDAHATGTLCSNRGVCDAGRCLCQGGYRGLACQYMSCPIGGTAQIAAAAAGLDTCKGGSTCATLRQLSVDNRYSDDDLLLTDGPDYDAWDADMIRGCVCNRTRVLAGKTAYSLVKPSGYNCQEYACPKGLDPRDSEAAGNAQFEVQRVSCWASEGHVAFRFRNSTSRYILWNTTVFDRDAPLAQKVQGYFTVERALLEFNVTGRVLLGADKGATFCDAATSTFTVTFASLEAPLPLLEVIPSTVALTSVNETGNATAVASVERITAGNIGPYTCSRRGACSRTTGICQCSKQYGYSDGQGNVGHLADCGSKDVLHKINRTLSTAATPTPVDRRTLYRQRT